MISLENIAIQILYGLVAVTIAFVAIVRQVGIKPLSYQITSSIRLSAKPRRSRTPVGAGRIRAKSRSKSGGRTVVHSSKTRKARRRSGSRRRGSPIVLPVAVTSDPQMLVAVVPEAVPSCPTCGLQAPQDLMMEHFQASPSHELGTPEPQPTIMDGDIQVESALISSDEDSRNSMRNLLQMLVPPRAFGRRHQHRTVNPLSHVIQTLEESRSGLIHPLK
jgi:hypothetical protein